MKILLRKSLGNMPRSGWKTSRSKRDRQRRNVKLVEDLGLHQEELNIQNEELLRVQHELEATRAKYFELYDLAPVGYIALTNDLIIKEANLTASKLLGIDRTNLFGKGLSAFVSPSSQESLYLHYRMLAQGKEKQVNTFLVKNKNGEELCIQFESDLVKEGSCTGFRSILTDVTDRKKAEVTLRDSEERYRTLFESMDEGFCIIERVKTAPGEPIDFRYLSANPSFTKHTGIVDVVGRTMREVVPREPQEWFDTYDAVLRTGEPIRFERGLVTQGRVLDLYAFRVEDGTERRVAVIFNDITERKKAEEALKQSESKYRLLHDTMLQGVVFQNADGTIISMNLAAERILVESPEEFIGSSSAGQERYTVHEDGTPFPGMEHPAMVALRTGKEVRDVVMGMYSPREKAYRWIIINAVPLFRPGEDRPYQVYTTFNDITERKRAERALKENEAKYRGLFENIQGGVILRRLVRDEKGEIVDMEMAEVNPIALKILRG